MTISQYFPIYDQLDKADQERLDYAAVKRSVPKGTLLHGGDGVCTGLLVIASGQLRAHMISEEGREITLYRLFERDICLLSASCMMPNIQFEVSVQAWERTEVVVIPAAVYQELAKNIAAGSRLYQRFNGGTSFRCDVASGSGYEQKFRQPPGCIFVGGSRGKHGFAENA